jgi:hypothetical protein
VDAGGGFGPHAVHAGLRHSARGTGEFVDSQALSPEGTFVRYDGEGRPPVTDGPFYYLLGEPGQPRLGSERRSHLRPGRRCLPDRHLQGRRVTPPTWLANLKANPECEIQIGRHRHRVTARPNLPDDPDYARRWTILNAVNEQRYTQYQRRTERPIAIVELRLTR